MLRLLFRLLFIHTLMVIGVGAGLRLAADGNAIPGFITALTGGLVLAGLPRPFRVVYGLLAPLTGIALGLSLTLAGTTRIGFAVALLSAGALVLRPFPAPRPAPRRI
jgi:hypothetical protein